MKILTIILFTATFVATSVTSIVAADNATPAIKNAAPARAIPFRGQIDSVDKQAKSFKINDRIFHVTGETRIMKDGKPATFTDITVNQSASGQYREGADKNLNVVSLRIGMRPASPGKPKPASPAK